MFTDLTALAEGRRLVITPMVVQHREAWSQSDNARLMGYRQQDAHDAFVQLLSACTLVDQHMMEVMKLEPSPNISALYTLPAGVIFGGVDVQSVSCCKCGRASHTHGKFNHLSLKMTNTVEESVTLSLKEIMVLDQDSIGGCGGCHGRLTRTHKKKHHQMATSVGATS